MFTYMESLKSKDIVIPKYKIGDVIGRLILGEVEKGEVYKIEGNERHFFYRTTVGCFHAEEGSDDIDLLEYNAEQLRKEYKTIIPSPLERRVSIKYAPRECDGYILTAQIGIYQNMLYWKRAYTYEFLEPYNTEKDLMKAYKKKLDEMTNKKYNYDFEMLDEPLPIKRLYWSDNGFYVSPKYVMNNG